MFSCYSQEVIHPKQNKLHIKVELQDRMHVDGRPFKGSSQIAISPIFLLATMTVEALATFSELHNCFTEAKNSRQWQTAEEVYDGHDGHTQIFVWVNEAFKLAAKEKSQLW